MEVVKVTVIADLENRFFHPKSLHNVFNLLKESDERNDFADESKRHKLMKR
jgi:hypothetical protein